MEWSPLACVSIEDGQNLLSVPECSPGLPRYAYIARFNFAEVVNRGRPGRKRHAR